MLQSELGTPGHAVQPEVVGCVVHGHAGHPHRGRGHAAAGQGGLDAQQGAHAGRKHPQQEHEHLLEDGREVLRAALVRLGPVFEQRGLAVHVRHGRIAAGILPGHEPVHASREVRQGLRVDQKVGPGVARGRQQEHTQVG